MRWLLITGGIAAAVVLLGVAFVMIAAYRADSIGAKFRKGRY